MNYRNTLELAIAERLKLKHGDAKLVADRAIKAVASVEADVSKPKIGAKKIGEVLALLQRLASTPLGKELLAKYTADVLKALDKGSFKKILAAARFVADLLNDFHIDELDFGPDWLNWIIETALQALLADSVAA